MPQTPTTVILVRHADVHNPKEVVYGRLPRFGLSATGREQAAQTAEALRALPVAALYSSPQLRARQTAQAIAALHPGLPVHITQMLAEIRTGWQGTPSAEMAARRFNFYDAPFAAGDETLAAIRARVLRWIGRVLRRYPGQVVVGVSHGDPIMIVRVLFGGQELTVEAIRHQPLYPAKGSITRLVFPDPGDPLGQQPEVTYADPSILPPLPSC